MKNLLVILPIMLCLSASATDYYISSSGNDANSGTSSAAPWKTLNKVNSTRFYPGDNIYFRRGDTFYGSLKINQSGTSGNPITCGSYGSGAKPIITGFTDVTSWTNIGGNIWESSIAVSALNRVDVVTIKGINIPMGRYPNGDDTYPFLPNYLTFQSHTKSGNNVTLTSSALSGGNNWTGAEAVVRAERWWMDMGKISSASGTSITYTGTSGADPSNGYGFYIQNDPRTLDKQNEWYYNPSTKKLRVYSTAQPIGVQVVSVDTLISLFRQSNITIQDLSFQGANINAVVANMSTNILVKDNDIAFVGSIGVYIRGCHFLTVDGNYITDCGSSAIKEFNYSDNIDIRNNSIKRSYLVASLVEPMQPAIHIQSDATVVEYNTIDSSGYNGITMNSANGVANNNFINHSCLWTDDGAGIYLYERGATLKVIRDNIVLNSVGSTRGISSSDVAASGIYADNLADNVLIEGNTVAGNASGGIFLHNNHGLVVRGNTAYDNGGRAFIRGALMIQAEGDGTQRNNKVVSNIFFAKTSVQEVLHSYSPSSNDLLADFGAFDSNYYAKPIDDTKLFDFTEPGLGTVYYDLAQWKSYTGKDKNSKGSPKPIAKTDELRFEYNPSTSEKQVTLDANYIDVTGKGYFGTVNLKPYTSIVLIRNGALTNQPPTASAGSDKTITLPANTASLSGSGSDIDGSIVSYSWVRKSGPSSYNFVNSKSPVTDVTGLMQGVYVFELTVTDDKGATASATVTVTVNAAPNKAPTASAGSNKSITLPTNTTTLSGSGSDEDGSIVSYSWTRTSGPSSYNFVNSKSPVTDVTGLVQGTYQFTLTVTDDKGATGSSTVTVTVNPAANKAPTANAGSNKTITLPVNTTSLSGSGSDEDGSIVSYSWTRTSGPSSFNFVNSKSPVTDVTGLVQGTYQFTLTVTDDKGATASATVTITVNAAPNKAPVASAGSNKTITLPTNTTTLSGSGTDEDGSIVSYSWARKSGPTSYNFVNSKSPVTDVTGLMQGVYIFELTVTDGKGATASATVTITVNAAPNKAPVANAGSNKTITLPTNTTTLSGSGTDEDGSIVSYSWSRTSGPSSYNFVNSKSPVTDVTGLVQGTYQFTLTVTDDKGATASATVTITVNAAPNKAPTVSAGDDQTITLPMNSVTLSGVGNDEDGTIVSYQWTKTSGPDSYSLTNSASASTLLTGLTSGVYTFNLKVTDNKGASATASVKITVVSNNNPPEANAGGDLSITLPENTVSLYGNGKDSDGKVVKYQWIQIEGPNTSTISAADNPQATVSGLIGGNYKMVLIVTDDKGATGSDTMLITVNVPRLSSGITQVRVYPNPVINTAKVEISGIQSTETLQVYVTDNTGKVLLQKSILTDIQKTQTEELNLRSLRRGIYYITLKSADGRIMSTKKIIKIR